MNYARRGKNQEKRGLSLLSSLLQFNEWECGQSALNSQAIKKMTRLPRPCAGAGWGAPMIDGRPLGNGSGAGTLGGMALCPSTELGQFIWPTIPS